MENVLKEGEIFVVDNVNCGAQKVLKIVYTKKTPKCYILKGIPGRATRHYKGNKCFHSFEDACKMAEDHNMLYIDNLKKKLKETREIMESQQQEQDVVEVILKRYEILDLKR